MSHTDHAKRYERRKTKAPYCCDKRGKRDCPWCRGNRTHANVKRDLSAREQLRIGVVP